MALMNTPRVKPPALCPGDTIGIVAPASNVNRDDLEVGCDALRRAGYKPFYFESIFEQDLYFAGSPERRTRELEEMFARDEVKAILCARGGYGANYLLQSLNLGLVKSHPKIFVGYSDATCLLTYFSDVAGLVTFHGPMAAKDWAHEGGVDLASWQAALSGTAPWNVDLGDAAGLAEGKGEGIFYGGCLSILVASLGTPYEVRTDGTILFLEDVATKPYQIDRMLMQLKLAGKFKGVRGLVFGEMVDCRQTSNQGYELEDVVLRIVEELGIPVIYGVRSGHVSAGNITLPFGVRASASVHAGRIGLNILESGVTS